MCISLILVSGFACKHERRWTAFELWTKHNEIAHTLVRDIIDINISIYVMHRFISVIYGTFQNNFYICW